MSESETPKLSQIEEGVSLLAFTFFEHAGKDGKLDKRETKQLIQSQFSTICERAEKDMPDQMTELFHYMDMEGDGLDFSEFMVALGFVTSAFMGKTPNMKQMQHK